MKYSSQLGCLFYYDRVLYNWRVCDSTMIFLLGFESFGLSHLSEHSLLYSIPSSSSLIKVNLLFGELIQWS